MNPHETDLDIIFDELENLGCPIFQTEHGVELVHEEDVILFLGKEFSEFTSTQNLTYKNTGCLFRKTV